MALLVSQAGHGGWVLVLNVGMVVFVGDRGVKLEDWLFRGWWRCLLLTMVVVIVSMMALVKERL